MTIAIDIDSTWDRDPDLFFDFAWLAKNRGHTVIAVSQKRLPQETLDRLYLSRAPISELIISGDELKDVRCLALGVKVDVWLVPQSNSLSALT